MKISARLAAVFATGTVILAAALPASAASLKTEAFVANVRPNVDFLDRSSRLALDNSGSARVRAYAQSEAREQTITANSLVAWIEANTTGGPVAVVVPGTVVLPSAVVAPAPIITAPVGLATVPVAIATDVVSGRSVAVDAPVAVDATAARRSVLPAGQNDLDRLATRHGRTFDALYRSTQADALRQLSTLYTDYIQNGDDPALVAIATTELPKINRRLAALRRI